MLSIREVADLDLPELAPYLTLRQQDDHFRERLFVAEGPKVVERLMDTELEVISALLTPDHLVKFGPAFEKRPERIQVFVAEKRVMEHLTGFTMYQGLLVCGRIPPPAELDVVASVPRRPRFLVAADRLANTENLGALVRNAAAFGAQGLMVGEGCVHPFMRRAVRASMGTIFDLPVVEPPGLAKALVELRRRGIRCIGAHPHTDRRLLADAQLGGDCCIVLGSEGEGLSAAVRDACDELVAVPMQGGVDSLNVAAASALFFYELWRQRRALGTH